MLSSREQTSSIAARGRQGLLVQHRTRAKEQSSEANTDTSKSPTGVLWESHLQRRVGHRDRESHHRAPPNNCPSQRSLSPLRSVASKAL